MRWKEINKKEAIEAAQLAKSRPDEFFLAIHFGEQETIKVEWEINEYNPIAKNWFYGEAIQRGEKDFSYATKPDPSNLEEILDSINFGDKFFICIQPILGFPLVK